MRKVVLLLAALLVLTPVAGADIADEIRTLDGSGNNRNHPDWGKSEHAVPAGRPDELRRRHRASRSAARPPATSATASSTTSARTCSPRAASPSGAWSWGQFLDHTFGLRDGDGPARPRTSRSTRPIRSRRSRNDLGVIAVHAHAGRARHGTCTNPRQQINTVSSATSTRFSVYGGTDARLDWLRDGPVDGNPANNGATLLLPGRLPAPRATPAATRRRAPADGR